MRSGPNVRLRMFRPIFGQEPLIGLIKGLEVVGAPIERRIKYLVMDKPGRVKGK